MMTVDQHVERNAKTIVSVVTVGEASPVASILSRFIPSADLLTDSERRRLLEACAAECRAEFAGGDIDWQSADEINRSIAKAASRSELIPLLSKYKAVVTDK